MIPQDKAELAIAAILRDLEVETACIVEHLSLQQLDVTSIRDDRQMLQRRVHIDLKPMPGTRWRTA